MKIGIIGPGKIAERFIAAVKQVEGVEVAAAASTNIERAKEFCKRNGVSKAYGSWAELLKDCDIDAVYVSVINAFHYEAVVKSLEAGKAVICEKPMGLSFEETDSMLKLAEKKKLLFMECLWTLHLPCILQAKRWINDGKIGRMLYIDCNFSFFAPESVVPRLFNKNLGGGALYDVGIYDIIFSAFMNDSTVESVKASSFIGTTGVDEMGASLIKFEDGVVANCRYGIRGPMSGKACIYGENGYIEFDEFWKCPKAVLKDSRGHIIDTVEDLREEGFTYQIEAFRDAFAEGKIEVEHAAHAASRNAAIIIDQIRREIGLTDH